MHYQRPLPFFKMQIQVLVRFCFVWNAVCEQGTTVCLASSKSQDADFPNWKGDRDILVIEESHRSSFVSRNVALTLDRSVDVFNSF